MALQWIDAEFETLDLNDKRREKRAKITLERYASMAESQPDASQDKSVLEATYRVANNSAISPNSILQAHRDAAVNRLSEHKTIILAQDTTIIDLTKPKRQVKGAGPLEANDKFGFFFHPLYAMSESGIPLGIVDSITWIRDPIRDDLTRAERAEERRKACYEEKESYRWLELLQSGEQLARANPKTHFIHVADSESDIFELLLEISHQAKNHDLIIRGCQDRRLVKTPNGPTTIDQALAESKICFESDVNIHERESRIAGETRPRRKSRAARIARVGLRATTLSLAGPPRPGGRLKNVTLNVVEAIELDPPTSEDPIRWVLLTSMPIDTVAQIQHVVSCYSLRWGIELLFKTLKSGLHIEKLKYETIDAYLTASSLLIVVAWRVEYVKMAARVDADSSCEKYVDPTEWKAAYMVANRTRKLPAQPLTIGEFLLLIAKIGGYLNKKGQGPPGSETVWRGLRKLDAYRDALTAIEMI